MFADKDKRKEKPKRDLTSAPGVWVLFGVIVLVALAIGVALSGILGWTGGATSTQAPSIEIKPFTLILEPTEPTSPANQFRPAPGVEGDLAWNKPTFASSYFENGYPSRATNGTDGQAGMDAWRSAESNRAWFYVDLGQPETFSRLTTTLFVDDHFIKAPETYYIVSDDLKTWRVVYGERNERNLEDRGILRVITLDEPVTARYVGLYAQKWGGGWADMSLFMVQP